jgi:hypothetical protein
MSRCRILFAWSALALTLIEAQPVSPCPFCAKLGPTISDRIAEADWAGVGLPSADGKSLTLEAVVKQAGGAPTSGTTSFTKSIGASRGRRLVMAIVEKDGALRPVRVQAAGDRLADYLVNASNPPSRGEYIRHLFRHLNDSDEAVRDDAYKGISKLNAAEIFEHAGSFDAAALRRWIADPGQDGTRIGLLGLLLGMAGDPADETKLHEWAESRQPRELAGRDGFLAGLALLNRGKAEDLAVRQLADGSEPLSGRQAALNAMSFMLDEMPRRDPQPLLERLTPALKHADLRDAVIDLLRIHQAHFASEEVFRHVEAKKPTKAAVKFAILSSHPRAKAFLAEVQTADAALVAGCRSDLAAEARQRLEPMPRLKERMKR